MKVIRKLNDFTGLMLAALLIFVGVYAFGPAEAPTERSSYSVPVHIEQGGTKLVVETGGELEMQSGAVLDLQSGTTIAEVSAADLEATDDLTVGDDADITGDLDVDGTTNLDAVDIDGAVDMAAALTLASDVENVIAPSVATLAITYTAGAGGSGTVATIADGEVWIILGVYANVTTDWDATAGADAQCDIGDSGDVDGLLDLDDAELQAADTEGTGAGAGWQGFMSADARGAYMAETPFVYAPSGSAETIDWACGAAGDDLEAGELTIYVVYQRIK